MDRRVGAELQHIPRIKGISLKTSSAAPTIGSAATIFRLTLARLQVLSFQTALGQVIEHDRDFRPIIVGDIF